jgi:hypothetical protein
VRKVVRLSVDALSSSETGIDERLMLESGVDEARGVRVAGIRVLTLSKSNESQ